MVFQENPYRAFQQKAFAIINQNPENQKNLFGKTFFYQPGPKVEKDFSGSLENQLVPETSESYHESSRPFPGSHFVAQKRASGSFTAFELKVYFRLRFARRKNLGYWGPKGLENLRKMKHFRRAKRAGENLVFGVQKPWKSLGK